MNDRGKFVVGDVIMLRSGGPLVTVCEIDKDGWFRGAWHGKSGKLMRVGWCEQDSDAWVLVSRSPGCRATVSIREVKEELARRVDVTKLSDEALVAILAGGTG